MSRKSKPKNSAVFWTPEELDLAVSILALLNPDEHPEAGKAWVSAAKAVIYKAKATKPVTP